MKVIGIRPYSFVDQDSGRTVSGIRLWCTDRLVNGEGFECKTFTLSPDQQKAYGYSPKIGDEIFVSLENGKCKGVFVVPKSN